MLYRCVNCGGNVVYEPSKKKMICQSCGGDECQEVVPSENPVVCINCGSQIPYTEFQSAGINQTIHKIYVIVLLSVTVALPASEISVETQSEILVCENLIVGKVPNTYLGVNKISSGYNLVP